MAKLQIKPKPGYVKCEHCEAYVKDRPRSKWAHNGYFHKELFDVPAPKIDFSIKCLECDRPVANSKNVLGRHLRVAHAMEYVDYVVKHEHAGVAPTCECGCGSRTTLRKGGKFDRFASKSCATSGTRNPMSHALRPISPNLGKVRTDEHIEHYRVAAQRREDGPSGTNRRELMKTEEYSQKQSEAQNIVYATTNHAEKVSRGINRFWSSDDPRVPILRQEATDRACDLLEQGKIGPHAPFKAEWVFNAFTSQMEHMDSSWETEFLTRCVEANHPITKKHSIRIKYLASDGVERTYVPDFATTDGSNILHEVKGHQDANVPLKTVAAEAWCAQHGWTFVFHDESEFK